MRKIISLMLALITVFFCLPAYAYEAPETIRVGLFYGSSSKSEYSLSVPGGATVTGGGGTFITEDTDVCNIKVLRDDFYHVTLTENYETEEEAYQQVVLLLANGIDAYFVLDRNSYSVRAGVFKEEAEADALLSTILSLGYSAQKVMPNSLSVMLFVDDNAWTGSTSSGIRVIPLEGRGKINDKEYRGFFEFYRDEKSDMAAVNVANLDDYIMGVVPKEVSPSWHEEALKAQAVVARTYAVTSMKKFENYGFNVDDTTKSQVYGGMSSEHERTNDAVRQTAGELVMYDGKPAEVFFFSSSGGRTENVENVWGGTPREYLVSVDDSYENPEEASYSSWTKTFTPDEIKEKLASSDINIGDVLDITIDEISESGRSIKTTILGTQGSHSFSFESIRSFLGLHSNCFTVSREDGETPHVYVLADADKVLLNPCGLSATNINETKMLGKSVCVLGKNGTKKYSSSGGSGDFILSGKGWGHGLGMSQWGAKGMADAGFTYKEIITHYFQNTEVS